MNIVLCSSFRNAAGYVGRYASQVELLRSALASRGDKLTCLWAEGDSVDDTLDRLTKVAHLFDARLIDATHGGPVYGPRVNAQRFCQLAYVANKVWEQLPAEADVVLWVESDLIWRASTLLALIDRLDTYPAVAPMVLDRLPDTGARAHVTFYDTWAFRRNGLRFAKARPYHADLLSAEGMLRMDSVGSVLVMRGDVARGVYVPGEDVLMGTCRMIYENGGSVWLDMEQTVFHP
jgi:hypothetical protein